MGSDTERLLTAMHRWSAKLKDVPGWTEFKRESFQATIFYDDPWPGDKPPGSREFKLPPEIDREHDLIMRFYTLVTSLQSLRDCEYYFRRYPFRGLPVFHHDHLRYICEMYFSRFYEFSERLKKMGNTINANLPDGQTVDIGALIKAFKKQFDRELRARNDVHHHDSFSDIRFDNIALLSAVNVREKKKHIDDRLRNSYRDATREWSRRVRIRSDLVEKYLDCVALMILDNCMFLTSGTDDAST